MLSAKAFRRDEGYPKKKVALTNEFVPALPELGVVGQTTPHDVDAVSPAGSDEGDALARGARGHFREGVNALLLRVNLKRENKS